MSSHIPSEDEEEQWAVQLAIAASFAPGEIERAQMVCNIDRDTLSQPYLLLMELQTSSQQPYRSEPQQCMSAPQICGSPQDTREGKVATSSPCETEPLQDTPAAILIAPARRNINDAILDLQKRSRDLPRLDVPYHDTWVFISPPAQSPDQDDSIYREIESRYKHPFGVRSATLIALESPILNKMFTSTAQFRLQGRHNLRNKLPTHIKYVIDLTPPNEGDQAILLVSNLSCSLDVRQWGLSSRRWNISKTLVGGHDEFTNGDRLGENDDARPESDASKTAASGGSPIAGASPPLGKLSSAVEANSAGKSTTKMAKHCPLQLPEDYTPTRHRLAIERVLTAVEGFDPKLDSAIKVWTTFAVAQNFEIKHSSLTDYIVRWLRAPPNTYFMEVLPEVTLKIADGLQCEPLCRDIFALLVGEKALAIACQERGLYEKEYNVHGRKKEDLSDGWTTRIEYASDELVSRVKSQFESLVGGDMYWVSDLTELKQLRTQAHGSSKLTQAYIQLESLLKDYLRGRIWQSLCLNYTDTGSDRLVGQPGGEALFHSKPFMGTWRDLIPQERIFTRTFWDIIRLDRFVGTKSNFDLDVRKKCYKYIPTAFRGAEIEKHVEARLIRRVNYSELKTSISAYRTLKRMLTMPPDSHSTLSTVGSTILGRNLWSSSQRAASTGNDDDQQSPLKRRRTESSSDDRSCTLPFRTHVLAPASAGPLTDHNSASATASHAEQSFKLEFELPIRNLKPVTSEPQLFDVDIDSLTTIDHSTSVPQSDTSAVLPSLNYVDPLSSPHDSSIPSAPPSYPPFESSDLSGTFNLNTFFHQAESYVSSVAARMLSPPSFSSADSFQLNLTDTLICLTDSELKYLPLWAGGNDDDTAGVYNVDVPSAISGFSTAGPSVHTGTGSSTASSEFEMLRDADSTVDTSTVVNDGFSDTIDRRRVYDADSTWDEVLAAKDTEGATQTVAGDDATLESQSTWEEVLTPTGSEEMKFPAEPNLAGMSREVYETPENTGLGPSNARNSEESYDDVFMEDEDSFEYDDDDDEFEAGGVPLQVETEDEEEADEMAEVVYSYREDKDAWR